MILLQGNVAAACSLWFHLAPDLHCNEHSGQSIIHCSFSLKKRKKNKQIRPWVKQQNDFDQRPLQAHVALLRCFLLCCVCQSWEMEKYSEQMHICVSQGGYTEIMPPFMCVFLAYRGNQFCFDWWRWWLLLRVSNSTCVSTYMLNLYLTVKSLPLYHSWYLYLVLWKGNISE